MHQITKIQIGASKIQDVRTKKLRAYKYSDYCTPNGWISENECLPIPFDLMYLEIHGKPKTFSGWWSGKKWEGLRLKPEYTIKKWKRNISND